LFGGGRGKYHHKLTEVPEIRFFECAVPVVKFQMQNVVANAEVVTKSVVGLLPVRRVFEA